MYYCVKQHDELDCGAACLSTICKTYGINLPLIMLRNYAKTDVNGTNIYGIIDAANQLGFEANAYKTDIAEWIKSNEITYPCIAHTINEDGMNHFVVINKISERIIYISDPDKGKRKLKMSEFEKIFTGYVIDLIPTNDLIKKKIKSRTFKYFIDIFFKNKIQLLIIALSSFCVTILGILISLCMQYEFATLEMQQEIEIKYEGQNIRQIYEELYQEHEKEHLMNELDSVNDEDKEENLAIIENVIWLKDNLYQLVLILVFSTLGMIVLNYIKEFIILKLSLNFQGNIVNKITTEILHMPQSHIDSWKTGDLIRRYTDAEMLAKGVVSSVVILLVDTILAIVGGRILYVQNHVLFYIILLTILIYIFIIFVFIKPMKNRNLKMMEAVTEQDSRIKEIIDGVQDIKLYAQEKYAQDIIETKVKKAIKKSKRSKRLSLVQNSSIELTSGLGEIAILIVSYFFISNGGMSISTYIAFLAMMGYFIKPIENLISLQDTIQRSIVSASRLSDILDDANGSNTNNEIQTRKFKCHDIIKLNNITFRYGNSLPILENMSLNIPIGGHLLIQGKNGCGKSTLAKLLMGLYSAENGDILFDDVSIKEYSASELRRNIVYVSQNSYFFVDSIKNNILFGVNENKTTLELAVSTSNISDIYEKKSDGILMYVEENGRNLSTGQRQKLAIARALAREPKIIILDEAMSNIDITTQIDIYKKIRMNYPQITLITIAHNLPKGIVVDKVINM